MTNDEVACAFSTIIIIVAAKKYNSNDVYVVETKLCSALFRWVSQWRKNVRRTIRFFLYLEIDKIPCENIFGIVKEHFKDIQNTDIDLYIFYSIIFFMNSFLIYLWEMSRIVLNKFSCLHVTNGWNMVNLKFEIGK